MWIVSDTRPSGRRTKAGKSPEPCTQVEIARDPALMASIAKSRAQAEAGKRIPLADLLAE